MHANMTGGVCSRQPEGTREIDDVLHPSYAGRYKTGLTRTSGEGKGRLGGGLKVDVAVFSVTTTTTTTTRNSPCPLS